MAARRRAPPPRDEQRKLTEDRVLTLARQGRPVLTIANDAVRIDSRGDTALVEDVAALLAWVSPGLLVALPPPFALRQYDSEAASSCALTASRPMLLLPAADLEPLFPLLVAPTPARRLLECLAVPTSR